MHCCTHTCLRGARFEQCVHLLLSVTEHYLFPLQSPEVRIEDNKDEEEGHVNESGRWDMLG